MWIDDLITQLEDDGVAQFDVDLFVGMKAAIPILPSGEATLQIIETAGTSPDHTQNATIYPAYIRPGAQITARAKSPDAAAEMADAAFQSLVKVRNMFINYNWHRRITANQMPFPMPVDDRSQARYTFNIVGDFNRRDGVVRGRQMFIESFGGNADAFVTPAVSDAYPSGATFDALVPGSSPAVLNAQTLSVGTYVLEVDARVASAGARVKVALFDLTNAPNTPIVELVFPADDTVGSRVRSTAIALKAAPTLYGIKMTVNSTTIGGAAWGARLLRI